MADAIALTPEDRGHIRSSTRVRLDRQLAKVRPGSYAFEILKRTAIGVFNDGFIHAGNLAYLAIMTLFPFFIVAAAILYFLGAGPVRGFAVSLGLGILTSIVTAVTMTRMMIAVWYRAKRPQRLPI